MICTAVKQFFIIVSFMELNLTVITIVTDRNTSTIGSYTTTSNYKMQNNMINCIAFKQVL